MDDVEITSGNEVEPEAVTLDMAYYVSLLQAKRELKELRAAMAGRTVVVTHTNVSLDELLTEYPELVDYSGMTVAQAVELFPDLFDYEVYERDC